jgi:hypothetical protein
MLHRTFVMACLLSALAACERAQESPIPAAAAPERAETVSEPKTISVAPEHFDRVRAEQFEKEEERLRRRVRN